jgi:hypothetical protein
MSKPKTTISTITGLWRASEGDVEFDPALAPIVLLSKLGLNRGNGERAVEFVWDSLASMMGQNGGVIPGTYLDKLLGDVEKYYSATPMARIRTPFSRPTDDALTVISIGRNSIRQRIWENARILRLDSLSEEALLNFTPTATIADLKLKAARGNNQAATAVLAQLEEYLGILFGSGGVPYEPKTIKPLTLRIRRSVEDDTFPGQEQQLQAVQFVEIFKGVAAFYKSSNKCDRVLIALAKDSTESRVNLEVSVRNQKIDDLESKLRDLEGRVAELDN